MEVSLAHVAVGASAASNALSANHARGELCAAFGTKNSVALVARDPRTPALLAVRATLPLAAVAKPSTRVTAVYLHAAAAPPRSTSATTARVLAGDSEGNVMLWTRASGGDEWHQQALVAADGAKISNESVSAVTAVRTATQWLYVAAFSSGHLAVFVHRADATVECVEVQALGVRAIFESLAATTWTPVVDGEEEALLAAGGVDGRVHLWALRPTLSQWVEPLDGHKGWVRALSFSRAFADGTVLLASGSQDQRVRLWKLSPGSRVSFDALLVAHEDWVTSLHWVDEEEKHNEPTLVSSSMDNTVVGWRQHATSRRWAPAWRVGELGGNGLLASVVLPTQDGGDVDLLALSLSGQLERWQRQPSGTFLPAPSLTGHTAPVTDVSWAPSGEYLVSLSLDQTTRVLAPWQANASWHEISRAQVHGYDINCGAFLNGDGSANDRFVCGADEKILRVFEAPDDIRVLVKAMKGEDLDDTGSNASRVEHAYLPELSLTNKSTDKKEKSKQQLQGTFSTLAENIRLPVGDTLAKKTLWPELRKLYGHGNELLCVASNYRGTRLASACKSREEKFAAIWIWNTSDWSAAQSPLEGHKSSVVQLAFSPNDEFLLSVSKDRQFCVFSKQENGDYALVDRVKAHKRIIWSCSWAPDSSLFATGARDQTFALWGKESGTNKWIQRGASVAMDSAVTAIAFAPWHAEADSDKRKYLLAVGLETGSIHIFTVMVGADFTVECALATVIPPALTPTSTVSRLVWSPSASHLQLASASSDHSVRLYQVQLQ